MAEPEKQKESDSLPGAIAIGVLIWGTFFGFISGGELENFISAYGVLGAIGFVGYHWLR